MESLTFSNGNKMPIVGLGTWLANDEAELTQALEFALEAGYRHFDTAYWYKNEAVVGKVLKKWLDAGKVARDELFVTTKLPPFGNSPKMVGHFLNKSLEALQLEYVNLYLMHAPFSMKYDEKKDFSQIENGLLTLDTSTRLEDTWKAMEEQVGLGKTKSIGLSNFDETQIQRIVKVAKIQPSCLQLELHAYLQEKSLRALCDKWGIRVCAYSPLGSPGQKELYEPVGLPFKPSNMLLDPIVAEIALKYSKSPAQILLRFLVQQGVVVIPKSTNAERLKENFQILDFKLTPEDLQVLQGLDKGDAGRTLLFKFLPGIEKHPEFPKQIKKSLELQSK